MEYFLARAFEVARLELAQVEALHAAEAIRPRAFMPHEIQKIFRLVPLKEHYGFPEEDHKHAEIINRMRIELSQRNLVPSSGDLSALDVDSVHRFDDRLLLSLETKSLDISSPKRMRIRDTV